MGSAAKWVWRDQLFPASQVYAFGNCLAAVEGGGFSLRPNWSRYGLLAVWRNSKYADAFFEESELMRSYRQKAKEIWTIRLLTLQSRWLMVRSESIFTSSVQHQTLRVPVAVITRAAIHWNRLSRFWQAVPATSRELESRKRLAAIRGHSGEAPPVRQATFSVWKSSREMQDFAYKTGSVRKEINPAEREKRIGTAKNSSLLMSRFIKRDYVAALILL
ncbi:MAG: hypothetical protein WKF84_07405 [Pyrinomonadaceae bacterium]